MTVLRAGARIRIADPGRCGDCPGAADNPPPPPTEPSVPPGTDFQTNDDIAILDGFEHLGQYLNGTDPALYTGGGGGSLSVQSDTRGGKTAGKCVQLNQTGSVGDGLQWQHKTTNSVIQTFRAYLRFITVNCVRGFPSQVSLFGWTDSSGRRYYVGVNMPSTGSVMSKWFVSSDVPGGGGNQPALTAPVVGIRYRVELVNEFCVSPNRVVNTLYVYDGDSLTPLEVFQVNLGGATALGGFPFIGPFQAGQGGNSLTLQWDDCRIQSFSRPTPGSVPTGGTGYLAGAAGCWPLVPAGPFTTQWTPFAGPNYTQVNEFPAGAFDDDASYVSSAGVGQLDDVYQMAPYEVFNPVPAGGITAVQVRLRHKQVTGPTPVASALYRSPSGALFPGPQRGIEDSAAYNNYPKAQGTGTGSRCPMVFLLYPAPLDTLYKSAQGMGVRRLAGNFGTCRVSDVWGWMDVRAT